MLVLIAGGIAFVFAEQYTRDYRDRAAGYDLSQINKVEIRSLILDRSGKEIGRIFVQNRSVIPIEEVPKLFIDTLRAGEDQRYYQHGGVDYFGVMRAAKDWLKEGEAVSGASTITQQLARNAYPLKQDAMAKGEGGLQRKMVEAFLSMRIEERYSKDEILGFYLNRIYFGSGFYGIKSASLGYFGKEPKDLNLNECAAIVGLIKNPTKNSPLNSIEASKKARNMVLIRMRDEGMISRKEMLEAQAKPVVIHPSPIRRGTSHLYERITDSVGRALGEDALAAGGFTIHTTIDANVQDAAEKALAVSLEDAEKHPGFTRQKYKDYNRNSKGIAPEYLQGAVFMVDHSTGEVLAHVGGRDYSEVPFDFIEMGRRPMGTAFFPFLYSAALANKHTPASPLDDEPMDNRAVMIGGREGILGEWGMEVSSPKYEGIITLRKAFENSKIAATVRLGSEIGIQHIIDAAVAFGFSMKDSNPLPRVSVGWEPASLKQAVTAMSTFPLVGKKGAEKFHYVDRIEDSSGRVVYRRVKSPNPSGRLLDEAVAWQMHSLMAGGMTDGSARGLADSLLEKPFSGAGKGGSTHEFSDAWFLGYNGRVTCGVWTGFLQGNSDPIYPGAFSRDLAMPVWAAAMNAATPAFGGKAIAKPDSIVDVEICTVSGQRATQFCQELVEDVSSGTVKSTRTVRVEGFRKGTENLPFCALHSGGGTAGAIEPGLAFSDLPAMDALPIRPTASVLIGDDPYHSELPSYAPTGSGGGVIRRGTNVMDSLELESFDEEIRIRRPPRLDVEAE